MPKKEKMKEDSLYEPLIPQAPQTSLALQTYEEVLRKKQQNLVKNKKHLIKLQKNI